MRILATAIVIAIAAMSAGCSGNSSSSSPAPGQTATQMTAAPTQAAAGPTNTAARPTTAASGSIHRGKAVPAHLAGRPLDVAEGMLHTAGISYKVIPLHGQFNGAASHWGVCDTASVANMSESSPVVDLLVVRLKCGGH